MHTCAQTHTTYINNDEDDEGDDDVDNKEPEHRDVPHKFTAKVDVATNQQRKTFVTIEYFDSRENIRR